MTLQDKPTREQIIRETLSIDEAIRRIQELGGEYSPDCELDLYDQLLACESVANSTPVKHEENQEKEKPNENVSLKWNGNDSYKRTINFELTERKLKLIEELKTFNYRTPPNKIVSLLEEFFREWPSKPTHWPYIAQSYAPKTINSVLNRLVKLHQSGYYMSIPPRLFTLIVKKRPKRKTFIAINDIRKQQKI